MIGLVNIMVENHEITISELATQTGISQPHLSHILMGKRAARDSHIEDMMDALCIRTEDLYSEDELIMLASWIQSRGAKTAPEPPKRKRKQGLHQTIKWYSTDKHLRERIAAGDPIPDELKS